jgi:transcriptional antiterminator RfaH
MAYPVEQVSINNPNMKTPKILETDSPVAVWYCLRSQPKREHIAAASLRQLIDNIEVFSPKLRVRRQTRRGAVWFVEALFPGYLFARFDLGSSIESVRRTPGVTAVVSFGRFTPSVEDRVIEGFRERFEQDALQEVGDDLRVGDEITVASGPFRGAKANVLRLLPAAERVQILLEMLGRSIPVELALEHVLTQKSVAQRLLASNA